MKLDQILDENVMWTDMLGVLVNKCIQFHANDSKHPASYLLRNYIAPMLSHAHDYPADIENPTEFAQGVKIIQGSFPNPIVHDIKQAIEELSYAMPAYHEDQASTGV